MKGYSMTTKINREYAAAVRRLLRLSVKVYRLNIELVAAPNDLELRSKTERSMEEFEDLTQRCKDLLALKKELKRD